MSKAKVMLIDDDELHNEMLKAALERREFEVCTETNALNAVKTALGFQPDIIICDIAMPGKSGRSVMLEFQVHRATRKIPFIFLSSLVIKREEGKGSDQQMMLAKPINIAQLEQCIHECLRPV